MSVEDDDWELLDSAYEEVSTAVPKASEAEIVDALRRNDYDADLAIAALIEKRKKKAAGTGKVGSGVGSGSASPGVSNSSSTHLSPGGGGGGGSNGKVVSSSSATGTATALAVAARSVAAATVAIPASSSATVACAVNGVPTAPVIIPPRIAALLASARPSLSIAVIGHVDAGKSTLLGRLLCDLGVVSARERQRLAVAAKEAGRASFALAWVLDDGVTERARGVTVDVAEALITLPNADALFLDAPGHRDFVPAMMTAASQADAAILVVDATPGGFEAGWGMGGGGGGEAGTGGLTREHMLLARSLGVSQLIVAVNKLDAPGVAWSAARFYAIRDAMLPVLITAGFKRESTIFVPVSGLAGVNIALKPSLALSKMLERRAGAERAEMLGDLGLDKNDGCSSGVVAVDNNIDNTDVDVDELRTLMSWYSADSPTLIEALNLLRQPIRPIAAPLRFCISDVGIGA
jgi:translation elongation factor EF-1alpha